jgi:hypothetical protein
MALNPRVRVVATPPVAATFKRSPIAARTTIRFVFP